MGLAVPGVRLILHFACLSTAPSAHECLSQSCDSAKHSPTLVPTATKPDAVQPDSLPYPQYLAVIKAQIACAKDIHTALLTVPTRSQARHLHHLRALRHPVSHQGWEWGKGQGGNEEWLQSSFVSGFSSCLNTVAGATGGSRGQQGVRRRGLAPGLPSHPWLRVDFGLCPW